MFGRRKQPPIRSLIGEGTVVEGTIRFSEGLRVDGQVVGDVVAEDAHPSVLVLSEKGSVSGKVDASHVIINGTVEGPVVSRHLLELQPKARIVGDVSYHSLEMHQGACIQGSMRKLSDEDRQPLQLLAPAPDKASA